MSFVPVERHVQATGGVNGVPVTPRISVGVRVVVRIHTRTSAKPTQVGFFRIQN